jgi:hypothetical protein
VHGTRSYLDAVGQRRISCPSRDLNPNVQHLAILTSAYSLVLMVLLKCRQFCFHALLLSHHCHLYGCVVPDLITSERKRRVNLYHKSILGHSMALIYRSYYGRLFDLWCVIYNMQSVEKNCSNISDEHKAFCFLFLSC